MRTRTLATGATPLVDAPALIALGPVFLLAQVQWTLILTRRLQRIFRIAFALAVAAVCPLALGVLVMWGMGAVFTHGASSL